jgi:hypothetical protein
MQMIVRHEGAEKWLSFNKSRISVPCCTRDEGRPLEAAIQVEASNRLKLLWPKSMVVSVKEKAKLDFVRYVSWRRTQVNR